MSELPYQALGEENERLVALFIVFPDGIEEVKLKETGIPHGVPDRRTETFGLKLLLRRKEENGDHDDEHQRSAEVFDPGLLQGI